MRFVPIDCLSIAYLYFATDVGPPAVRRARGRYMTLERGRDGGCNCYRKMNDDETYEEKTANAEMPSTRGLTWD